MSCGCPTTGACDLFFQVPTCYAGFSWDNAGHEFDLGSTVPIVAKDAAHPGGANLYYASGCYPNPKFGGNIELFSTRYGFCPECIGGPFTGCPECYEGFGNAGSNGANLEIFTPVIHLPPGPDVTCALASVFNVTSSTNGSGAAALYVYLNGEIKGVVADTGSVSFTLPLGAGGDLQLLLEISASTSAAADPYHPDSIFVAEFTGTIGGV